MANRIKTIQSLLEKDPGDVFLHYSLAMEFCARSMGVPPMSSTARTGVRREAVPASPPQARPGEQTSEQLSKLAQEQFSLCIQLDPNYLPAYVELGKCYRTACHFQKAREVFAAGLQLAAAQGQPHTQDYIRQQIEGLPNA
jgi:hypothetical protein